MKKNYLFLGVALVALVFTSCKNEKAIKAEKSVDSYVVYVDSIGTLPAQDAQTNWQAIAAAYQVRASEAELALENIKEKEKAQEKINASKVRYEELKSKIEADLQASSSKQRMRNALFGEGKIGMDMNFNWINKDNILSVYEQFVKTAKANKDSYSREDWDEIKLLYEGLDSRKNTVEKEGLSSKDNKKIAGLKMEFAPMLKMNRMGEKTKEMEKAKE